MRLVSKIILFILDKDFRRLYNKKTGPDDKVNQPEEVIAIIKNKNDKRIIKEKS